MTMRRLVYGLSLVGLLACGDDDKGGNEQRDGGSDASTARDASMDSGSSLLDAALDASGDAASADAGPTAAEKIARGKYLVENVGACGDCHTPRLPGGAPDLTKVLSGTDCFVDQFPEDATMGCLSSRNLTNHETGLKNFTDQAIKDMFTHGKRPDGSFLVPVMPYYVLGNMTDADADAIVAFLRTVPGVDHMVAAAQAPFANWPAASPTWPEALIPQPSGDYPDQAAAKRGRYLAGEFGVCMECHTPWVNNMPDVTRAFQGGRSFPAAQFHLDISPATDIYTSNLTPDQTGIKGYTVDQIVNVLHQGKDKDNTGICPPMPVGPMGPFAGITDADARDIAHYLLSLAPKENMLPNGCMLPAPQ